ncbi:hypothetical protein ATM97_29520 [Nocardia sp. MH4]|nr:hypothetical protein [Nocardia sp. MH4]
MRHNFQEFCNGLMRYQIGQGTAHEQSRRDDSTRTRDEQFYKRLELLGTGGRVLLQRLETTGDEGGIPSPHPSTVGSLPQYLVKAFKPHRSFAVRVVCRDDVGSVFEVRESVRMRRHKRDDASSAIEFHPWGHVDQHHRSPQLGWRKQVRGKNGHPAQRCSDDRGRVLGAESFSHHEQVIDKVLDVVSSVGGPVTVAVPTCIVCNYCVAAIAQAER